MTLIVIMTLVKDMIMKTDYKEKLMEATLVAAKNIPTTMVTTIEF